MGNRRVFWRVWKIVLFGRHRKLERSLDSLYRAKWKVHWELKPMLAKKINSCSFYHVNIKHPSSTGLIVFLNERQVCRVRSKRATLLTNSHNILSQSSRIWKKRGAEGFLRVLLGEPLNQIFFRALFTVIENFRFRTLCKIPIIGEPNSFIG